MKKKNKKKKVSIFIKLILSYFTFSTIAIVSIFIGSFVAMFAVTNENLIVMEPNDIVTENGQLGSLEMVYRLGGWVETLDENHQVIEIHGKKQTTEMSYTINEIFALTKMGMNTEHRYTAFYLPQENDVAYFLFYPVDSVHLSITYNLNDIMDSNANNIYAIFILALLIADGILVSIYIYRKIRKPMKQMIGGMKRVESGESNVRLDFKTEGEFMEIQNAFNVMIQRVEQKEAEKEKIQNDRNQMLLELSHDLKTPLATITSYAAALEEGVVLPQDVKKYCHTIRTKADNVNSMTDDMFAMLKLESTDYQIEAETKDICEFLRQLCAGFYEDIVDSGLDADIDIPDEEILVSFDAKILGRAISNLISNAEKYNKSGNGIWIQLWERDTFVFIQVADNGTPVDATIRDTLFSPFVRGDKSRKTSNGSGLGLSIARAVITKHQGDIYYSYEEGKNKFIIALPRGEASD